MSEKKTVEQLCVETTDILQKAKIMPRLFNFENLSVVKSEIQNIFKTIIEKKEIILFAVLQWIIICIGYKIWIEYYHWAPEDLPQRLSKGQFKTLSFVWCFWSLLVLAIVSYPLSILNGCIVNVFYFKKKRLSSTLLESIKQSTRNMDAVWYFTLTDAIITVTEIISRIIPKSNKKESRSPRNVGAASYYAWKIGSVGMLPSLVAGNTFFVAAKESLAILSAQPKKTIGIRMGYSLTCWIVGGSIYILMNIILYFNGFNASDLLFEDFGLRNSYQFYASLTVSIIIAVGMIMVLVRPFYLILISKLYVDTFSFDASSKLTVVKKTSYSGIIFGILVIVTALVYFYGSTILLFFLHNNFFS